ncbi:MAG: hypothetical protein GWP06_11430 [Actinobacteria bacterium]|nr:hypothetical protein [Actinomycetota bacterium]
MAKYTNNSKDFQKQWQKLDAQIRSWWDDDIRKAGEEQVCDPNLNKIWYADEEHRRVEEQEGEQNAKTLLFLPFPYLSGGGSESAFPEMYCWDIYFINLALAAHGRFDLIKNHILNQLFSIERFGMVLNGNRTYYLTRSQTPLHPASIELYFKHHRDRDLLARAYPLLKKEYNEYWQADHHQTPTGLATNRDIAGLKTTVPDAHVAGRLRPELAAEAEVLDFTSIFAGDVRKCVPLQTNCALVRYAKILAWMAAEIGWEDEAGQWQNEAERRANKIRELCWSEEEGFFFEYQFEKQEKLPYWSLAAYWTMWAGVASEEQAAGLVENLHRFEYPFGLTQTAKVYNSPHKEFAALQWDYPSGWPPMQIMVADSLAAYGYYQEANRIANAFLQLQIRAYNETGNLWEKYNVVDGNTSLPRERYDPVPLHGWSSASAVLLGRRIFSA